MSLFAALQPTRAFSRAGLAFLRDSLALDFAVG